MAKLLPFRKPTEDRITDQHSPMLGSPTGAEPKASNLNLEGPLLLITAGELLGVLAQLPADQLVLAKLDVEVING